MTDDRLIELQNRHGEYLHSDTPLSERQADVLAIQQIHADPNQISQRLDISPSTANKHWNNTLNKLTASQTLVDILGQSTPDYNPDARDIGMYPWEQLVRADYEVNDDTVSLRLYVDPLYQVTGYDYFLVEHRTSTPQQWKSHTETTRSSCTSEGLRQTIYESAESLFDWVVRMKLLETAGIDPGAEGAIGPERAFGVEWDSDEVQSAATEAEQHITRNETVERLS